MYIYNVTVNVEPVIHSEWLNWMKENHIPQVMDTGFFGSCRILQVMAENDHGFTYSIQYTVKNMALLKQYQLEEGPRLQQESVRKFGEKALAFRTVLRVEHDHEG